MENGNSRDPTRAYNPEMGENVCENITEDGYGGERRGTFGKPILTGQSKGDDGQREGSVADDAPAVHDNLDEPVADPVGPLPIGGQAGKGQSLEEMRSGQQNVRLSRDYIEMQSGCHAQNVAAETLQKKLEVRVSKLARQLYTLSYLVFFSIFGTLARLGLQALTTYPDAPVSFGVLWANVGGSVVMGFLAEDRKLFQLERSTAMCDELIRMPRRQREDIEDDAAPRSVDLVAAKKAHLAMKKTIPLYIGLTTGFCGSFTSFSSFIRDVFLATTNDLPATAAAAAGGGLTTTMAPGPRNGGYSLMAMLAVIITTVGLSLSGLFVGAHLAAGLDPITPSASFLFDRKRVLDRVTVLCGWGCWFGAVLVSIWPPHDHDAWRGQATFSLVFAPLGCFARFYVSMWLNARAPAFPMGTFAVNMVGVAILGICWDLGHAEIGGVVGCQVLQGVEDGFCGCLTTVSTWVAELAGLRRRHAYMYGAASVATGFAIMVVIMGGLRWSDGFGPLMCIH